MNQDHQYFRVIVIDDGSSDDTPIFLSTLDDRFTVIRSTKDLWWARSINLAFKYLETCNISDSDRIMIINDDVSMPENFLSEGIRLSMENPKSLIGANFREKNDSLIKEAGICFNARKLELGVAEPDKEINMLSTKGLVFGYRDLKFIGYFKPNYLPHYFSDYEWTFRAYSEGFKLLTFKSFFLEVDSSKTGLHDLSGLSGFNYLRSMFSKRYVMNPVYLVAFAWLTGKWKSCAEILRIVYRAVGDIVRATLFRTNTWKN
jgi:GT2 family glycosyltransferase